MAFKDPFTCVLKQLFDIFRACKVVVKS